MSSRSGLSLKIPSRRRAERHRGWAAACALVPLVATGSAARADVTDLFQRLGGWLSARSSVPPAPGSLGRGDPHRFLINGQVFDALVGRTTRSIRDVLDHYQSVYPGGELKNLAAGKPLGMRREGELTGELLTVDASSEARARELLDGRRTLLSAGPLRLVYARRTGGFTDYVALSSARPVPEDAVDPPQDRDAPGADLEGVPRPVGAIRTLAFIDQRSGYALVQYRVPQSPPAALALAEQRLRAEGFVEDHALSEAAGDRQAMRVFTRGAIGVMVRARSLGSGSQLIYVRAPS